MEQVFKLPRGTFSNLRKENSQITFKVNPNYRELNASQIASRIGKQRIFNLIIIKPLIYFFHYLIHMFLEDLANVIKDLTGYHIKETGIGDKVRFLHFCVCVCCSHFYPFFILTLLFYF